MRRHRDQRGLDDRRQGSEAHGVDDREVLGVDGRQFLQCRGADTPGIALAGGDAVARGVQST